MREITAINDIIARKKKCDFCKEPIPSNREEGSRHCSDACARESRQKEEALEEEDFERGKREEEEREIEPSSFEDDDFDVDIEESDIVQLERDKPDYWTSIQKKWVDGHCFYEVLKWDKDEFSSWNGDPMDPNWIVVPPTKHWQKLSPLELEHLILNHNPTGGNFQVKVFKMSARNPVLLFNPFFFHFSSKYPEGGGDLKNILPILESQKQSSEREKERLEKEKKQAEDALNLHLSKMMDQQDRLLRRGEEESNRLRTQILEKDKEERERELRRQEILVENQTRQFEAMQRSQAEGLANLTTQISSLFHGGGGMGGKDASVGVIAAMMQMMMQQSASMMEAQREQAKADRMMQIEQMKMFANMQHSGNHEDVRVQELSRRCEDLERRYLDSLEKRHQLPPATGSKLESLVEKVAMGHIENMLLKGGKSDAEEKGPDMLDKLLTVVEKTGLNRIPGAVAERIKASKQAEESAPLRNPEVSPPMHDVPPSVPQTQHALPSTTQTNNPQNKERPELMKPSDVKSPQDILEALYAAITNNMTPEQFVTELPEQAKSMLSAYETSFLQGAIDSMNLAELKTPRARRWIQDAHGIIKKT